MTCAKALRQTFPPWPVRLRVEVCAGALIDHADLVPSCQQDVRSLRSALSTLQEDHADLKDTYDALSHTTTQKLAAQAAELTARERQVESLSAELHSAHEAAATHSAEVLRLQAALDAHSTTQTDISRHEAEEASWSVLRIELTRQAEHSRHLETSHARAMAKLNTLRERHTAMEVLREENRALERRTAAMDELCESVRYGRTPSTSACCGELCLLR
jgi:mitotic spindle assembly checkpoint protein MAD1